MGILRLISKKIMFKQRQTKPEVMVPINIFCTPHTPKHTFVNQLYTFYNAKDSFWVEKFRTFSICSLNYWVFLLIGKNLSCLSMTE